MSRSIKEVAFETIGASADAHLQKSRRFNRYLADHMGSRDNRIDQLRLGAALAVVLGHSWFITLGRHAQVPLENLTLFGFHSLAVHVFFFLSGLLVTESAQRHATKPMRYVSKRAMRIMPALIVNALLVPVVLIATGAWTGVGFGDMARYTFRLVTLFSVEFEHPHAFANSPFAGAINGSVWSLRHEIIVYALLIFASMSGALARPGRRIAFLAVLFAYVAFGHLVAPHAHSGALFLFAEGRYVMWSFLLGVAAHQFAKYVPLHPVIALPGVALLIVGEACGVRLIAENAIIYLVCAGTLLIAYPRGKSFKLPYDVSYGVYIYSWPVQQLTVFFAATMFGIVLSPLGLFFICLGPLLVIALGSWLWVERPALALLNARQQKRAPVHGKAPATIGNVLLQESK